MAVLIREMPSTTEPVFWSSVSISGTRVRRTQSGAAAGRCSRVSGLIGILVCVQQLSRFPIAVPSISRIEPGFTCNIGHWTYQK